ncbi:MAG: RNA polymerase sigma factor [Ignavibacteriales bacterium]|nr:RNA polymerase sigma factor [Ignavibacteriales bacterium]MBI3788030.1 RNA polymerase sigma factor [Ignavibacteriales bacterium]
MTERSDLELVRLFQQGEESAFNHLVLRYQEKIYWVARRFINEHDGADDVTQEVFVKAYESLKEFRSESSFYTWLYRITVNIALNVLRRNKVKEFFRIDELFDPEDVESGAPDELLERQEERTLIERAIATLPDKQKAVFLLRYYEEMPYEEIAKVLKTSVGGLKANYFHAVKKIEEYLKRAHGTH